MNPSRTPGVWREEVFLQAEARLPSGVAGFAGFVAAGPAKPAVLHHPDDFAQKFRRRADSHLEAAVDGFFRNGGTRCHVAAADPALEPRKALEQAVESLATVADIDLLAVPDAMTLRKSDLRNHAGDFVDLNVDAIAELQRSVLKHCAGLGDRFALLDALPLHAGGPAASLPGRAALEPQHAMSGALYAPWLRVPSGELRPPCGHVAGLYARSDAHTGVHKAPANEALDGLLDLEDLAGVPDDINPLRAFRGRGIRVWGARTLCGEAPWRHVNVRRLVILVRRWIDRNMQWSTFEPAGPALWQRIERELGAFLDGLWQRGALRGATPRQAYYVRCDAETNPGGVRSDRVVTEIGLAPTLPAEFVVVRIVHRPAVGADEQPV